MPVAIRQPVVAGTLYPKLKRPLSDLIDRLIDPRADKREVLAVVVPHGGYLSSGSIAGSVYSRIRCPSTTVVLGPSHLSAEKHVSLLTGGRWATPLGEMAVDKELAQAIRASVPGAEEDLQVHRDEHSVEVQIPFLQRLGEIQGFVPIVLSDLDLEEVRRTGIGMAEAIGKVGRSAGLILSTNLTRYEPRAVAEEKDREVIQRILELDEKGLLETVHQRRVSMCGAVPLAVGLVAAKRLGARRAELVKYLTSGQATSEDVPVCGYVGVLIR